MAERSEYHRARRGLVASSAVLLFWNTVGVSVEGAEAGTGLFGLKILVANQETIPLVVAAFLAFFFCRYLIEWGESADEHKRSALRRRDHALTITVGIAAPLVFVVQSWGASMAAAGTRVVDSFPYSVPLPEPVLLWIAVAAGLGAIVAKLSETRLGGWKEVVQTGLVGILVVATTAQGLLGSGWLSPAGVSFVVGILAAIGSTTVYYRRELALRKQRASVAVGKVREGAQEFLESLPAACPRTEGILRDIDWELRDSQKAHWDHSRAQDRAECWEEWLQRIRANPSKTWPDLFDEKLPAGRVHLLHRIESDSRVDASSKDIRYLEAAGLLERSHMNDRWTGLAKVTTDGTSYLRREGFARSSY